MVFSLLNIVMVYLRFVESHIAISFSLAQPHLSVL